MRGWIRVAAATPPLHPADPQENAEEIRQVLSEADERGADVVVLPACALTGATLGDLFSLQTLQTATEDALDAIVEASRNTHPTLVTSVVRLVENQWTEQIVVVQNGMCRNTDRFSFRNRYDGSLLCRCAVSTLYSLPSAKMDEVLQEETHLLLIPAAIPAQVGQASRLAQQITALSARGLGVVLAGAGEQETGIDTLYAGDRLLAENGRLVADGGTLGCDPFFYGTERIAQAPLAKDAAHRDEANRDEVNLDEVNLDAKSRLGAKQPLPDAVLGESSVYYDFDLDEIAASCAEPENTDIVFTTHGEATKTDSTIRETTRKEKENAEEDPLSLPLTPRRHAEWCVVDSAPFVVHTAQECEEILQIQARALARRMRHVKTRQAWIGLSGGLDSTLAFLVTLRAFALDGWDKQGIHLISMPAFGTGKRTRSNAAALGELSGCDFREISLTPVLERHFQDIGLAEGDRSVAFENAQARERTQILMDLANLHGGLHVGTGDFSESALGWSTFNGDHMAMFSVNGSLPKTLVQALVAYEAKRLPAFRTVLEDILQTPISPELLPGEEGEIAQKTEEVIGPYAIHDFYLYYFLRYRYAPDKLLALAQKAFADDYSTATLLFVLRKMLSRFFASQFKRSVMVDGISVGPISLSPRGGWRMPSDVQATAWLSAVDRLEEEGEW